MLTLFETKKAKAEKAHLRNLIALAHADGHLSKVELELIYKLGEARGLEEDEVTSLINEDLATVEVKVPTNDSERFEQTFELVQVMLADGKVEDAEFDFCIELAERLGFSKAFAGVVVNKIAMGISNQIEKEGIKSEMESFLKF